MNTNDLGENHGNAVQAGYVGHLSVGSVPDRPTVPRQLPFALPGFIGRNEYLATLDRLLNDDGTTALAAVVGTAGVGKTSLVVRWARRVQEYFPDGTLYVNLHGYGPFTPATPGEVLADLLTALGIQPERVPPHQDARAALYRSVLASRRVLIVLDNANSAEQLRPLLPGGSGCVVVTSRSDLKGLEIGEGARRVPLPLLTGEEATELVRTVLGPRPAEPGAVTALVDACARLPLALRIAAGRIAANPHLTVAELVEELQAERLEALSVPDDDHTAVRTVFDWSYRRLPPEQAQMFRRIGLLPALTIGVHMAAVLCDVEPPVARRLLAALAAQHLLELVGKDRYTCHDLLRAYAADLAEQATTATRRFAVSSNGSRTTPRRRSRRSSRTGLTCTRAPASPRARVWRSTSARGRTSGPGPTPSSGTRSPSCRPRLGTTCRGSRCCSPTSRPRSWA